MYDEIYRAMIRLLKNQRGCKLRELAGALPQKYPGALDATPEDLVHDPALKLIEWGLAEAFLDGKPVTARQFKQYERWKLPMGITLFISKAALDMESLLGIDFESSPASILGDHRRMRNYDWPTVFVVMPFAEEMHPIYVDHIKPTVEKAGLTIRRADDFFTSNRIVSDIWAAINHAQLVIADCTGRNPNVFYEIGLCHAVGKSTLLITQELDDVPFDLRHLRVVEYAYNPRGMKQLEEVLERTVATLSPPREAPAHDQPDSALVERWAREHRAADPWNLGPRNWERVLFDLGYPGGIPHELIYERDGRLRYQ